eukprot:GHVP01069408.1.p1 GENE.GHVP01069408.1~~GHVP01069408.1.p1  ORF type:complete len:200 (+),score=29.54 GHVP01069408.1:53-652(+)
MDDQPHSRWLKEVVGVFEIYYFFWGTSVFKIKFKGENDYFPKLEIWHPSVFQQVLKARDRKEPVNARSCRKTASGKERMEIDLWRTWFREQSQTGKDVDVNHQCFLRHLWLEAMKQKNRTADPAIQDKPGVKQTDKSFQCQATTSDEFSSFEQLPVVSSPQTPPCNPWTFPSLNYFGIEDGEKNHQSTSIWQIPQKRFF